MVRLIEREINKNTAIDRKTEMDKQMDSLIERDGWLD